MTYEERIAEIKDRAGQLDRYELTDDLTGENTLAEEIVQDIDGLICEVDRLRAEVLGLKPDCDTCGKPFGSYEECAAGVCASCTDA